MNKWTVVTFTVLLVMVYQLGLSRGRTAGDYAGYLRACQSMSDQFGTTENDLLAVCVEGYADGE